VNTNTDGGPIAAQSTFKLNPGTSIITSDPVLVLDLVTQNATGQGYVNVFKDGITQPNTAMISHQTAETVANMAFADTHNSVTDMYVGQPTGTTVHLVIDCFGFFAAS
jgi:hypothetical protein